MNRLAAFLLIFSGTLCAAPVPVPRAPKPGAGFPTDMWILATRDGGHWGVRFEADGRYRANYAGLGHHGTWVWTPKTRSLRIVERPEIIREDGISYGPWSAFTVVLDRELRGRTNYGVKVDLGRDVKLK